MLNQRGFTLLEMALFIAVLGVLLSFSHQAWVQTQQLTKSEQNQQQLHAIKQALLNHLKVNHFLPCPDTDQDGYENRRANGTCQKDFGPLPYLNLGGIGHQDAYGQPFLYATNRYSDSNTASNNSRMLCRSASAFARSGSYINELFYCPSIQQSFCLESQCESACNGICQSQQIQRDQPPYLHRITPPLGTSTALLGALRVCGGQLQSCTSSSALSKLAGNLLPVVIVSFGANGAPTWKDCQQAHPLEQENCDGDGYFLQHPISEQFDDQLAWLTIFELKQTLRDQINWH